MQTSRPSSADLYTIRDNDEESLHSSAGTAGDSIVALLLLVLAQGSDAHSTPSGSVLAGKYMGSCRTVCQMRFII